MQLLIVFHFISYPSSYLQRLHKKLWKFKGISCGVVWRKKERKISFIKWVNVCKRKEDSRLGVKCNEKFNVSLLCKWKWWFNKKITVTSDTIRGRLDSIWWWDLLSIDRQGTMFQDCFVKNVGFSMDNGDKLLFRNRNGTMMLCFLRDFPLCLHKYVSRIHTLRTMVYAS